VTAPERLPASLPYADDVVGGSIAHPHLLALPAEELGVERECSRGVVGIVEGGGRDVRGHVAHYPGAVHEHVESTRIAEHALGEPLRSLDR